LQRLSPHFYRDGLLQHTRAVSHVGEPLQQSAAALVSHYGRPLQHRAAARPCAAAFIHTTVGRCSTGDSHPSAPLQQTAAAYQFAILFFSPQHTAIAGCCSTDGRATSDSYSRWLQHIKKSAAK